MDFKPGYTPQLEEFRREVASVLDSVPPDEVGRALSQRGWLSASEPSILGGAGLTEFHETVVAEQLAARGLTEILDPTSAALRRVIHGYGSPDQAKRFIPQLASGKPTVWSLRADNPYDLDPANLTISASRDGDDYILEGHGDFVGQGTAPALIWTWAAVEGGGDVPWSFLVPSDAEGVHVVGEVKSIGRRVTRVEFHQVRVPIYSALGTEGTGWQVALRALDSRQLAGPLKSAVEMDDLLSYAINTERDGQPLILEPMRQIILMDAFIESHVAQLMNRRNSWMKSAGKEMTYQAAQADLMGNQARAIVSNATYQVAGPYGLLDSKDSRASSLLTHHNEDEPSPSEDWARQRMAISLGLEKSPVYQQN